MKFYYNDKLTEKIQISQKKKRARIVVLLPVTRITEVNQKNWERALKIAEKSEICALVVLDKTPNAEATEYFSNINDSPNFDIYILRRSPEEQTYDSMALVSIQSGLWIMALHDDDQWDGVLAIPNSADGLQLFTTNFEYREMGKKRKFNWEDSPPVRINFTLLPSEIWNRFTQYVSAQGGRVGGSSDATLNLVSRLACEQFTITTFNYIYDNKHWENRKTASRILRKLSIHDGWKNLAGVDIQLMNRTFDNFSAIYYFKDLYQGLHLEGIEEELIETLALSRKRIIFLYTRRFIMARTIRTLIISRKLSPIIIFNTWIDQAEGVFKADNLVIEFSRMSTSAQIVTRIRQLRASKEFPKLENRFMFWEIYLGGEIKNSGERGSID